MECFNLSKLFTGYKSQRTINSSSKIKEFNHVLLNDILNRRDIVYKEVILPPQ